MHLLNAMFNLFKLAFIRNDLNVSFDWKLLGVKYVTYRGQGNYQSVRNRCVASLDKIKYSNNTSSYLIISDWGLLFEAISYQMAIYVALIVRIVYYHILRVWPNGCSSLVKPRVHLLSCPWPFVCGSLSRQKVAQCSKKHHNIYNDGDGVLLNIYWLL